ncbi:MAG: OB-fold nucleic acid binding domain-containing protein [Desulfomonilaceae bacterium]
MKQILSFNSDNSDCAEKTLREVMSMSVYCHAHPLVSLRNLLRKQKVVTSRDLHLMPNGSTVRVSGLVIIVHTPPTKSGKRVMFLTLEDEMGLFEVVVFPRVQNRFAKLILTSQVLTLEGKLQRQGVKGISISIVMEKALIGLSGSLVKLLTNVIKVRIIPNKKVHTSPTSDRSDMERDRGEFPEQLSLGY